MHISNKNNNKKIVNILKSLYASEWLAAYQYKVSEYLLNESDSGKTKQEFRQHYFDEINHAEKLAERIIQLGGTPVKNFSNLEVYSFCKYPNNLKRDNKLLVEKAFEGEKCAVEKYKIAIDKLRTLNDVVTLVLLVEILGKEEKHLEDLKNFIKENNYE